MNEILKRIIGLSLAGILVLSIAAGGTWAFLADFETSNQNRIYAGTLDLVPSTGGTNYLTLEPGGNKVNGYAVFTRLRPGQSGTLTWTLQNQGSFDGTLTLAATVTFSEGTHPYPELISAIPGNNSGGNGDLDEYVGVRVTRNGTYILGSAENYVPMSGLQAALNNESEILPGGDTFTYVIDWSVAKPLKGAGPDGLFGTPDDVPANPNIIQGDTAQIDVVFTLTQVTP